MLCGARAAGILRAIRGCPSQFERQDSRYDQIREGGEGSNYGYLAWAVDADTGERVEGPKVDWAMVKAEGWDKDKRLRDGSGVQKSKWNTMSELMFRYRAAAFFVRTCYPDVLMGMHTVEEIEDSIIDVEAFDAEAKRESLADRLKVQAEAAKPAAIPTEAPPAPKKRGRPPKAQAPVTEPAAHAPTPDPTGAGDHMAWASVVVPLPASDMVDPDLDVLYQWREAIKLASLSTIDEYRVEASRQFAEDEDERPGSRHLTAEITSRRWRSRPSTSGSELDTWTGPR